ncbi:MAG: hypothetical protein HDS35_06670 [Bacteroides sp.]|nr:hypothetical protein [Bacteroides sp.]
MVKFIVFRDPANDDWYKAPELHLIGKRLSVVGFHDNPLVSFAIGTILWYEMADGYAVFHLTEPWNPNTESKDHFIERLENYIDSFISRL